MGAQLDSCAFVDVDRRNLPKTRMLSGRPVLFKLMCYSPRIAPGVKVPESEAIRLAFAARQSDWRLIRPRTVPVTVEDAVRGTLMHLATPALTVIGWSWRG
jgi:hypothetical protein